MTRASNFKEVVLSDAVARRVIAGDATAIAKAYEQMDQAVMNLAYRMLSDRNLAEEVLQDTFLDLLQKSSQIAQPGAIAGWVRTVAVNHCLMKLRSPWHSRRTQADEEQVSQMSEMQVSMHETTSSASLESALNTLSDDSRAVLWLHDVEGYTHKEIGQLMGKTASFSKSQLARAYTRLMGWRDSLERSQNSLERSKNSLERSGNSLERNHQPSRNTNPGPAPISQEYRGCT